MESRDYGRLDDMVQACQSLRVREESGEENGVFLEEQLGNK